jgi:glycosyltransferase involved in cell wall biosynthesis
LQIEAFGMLRVYVSCYQYQDFIEECLSSVARQSRSDFLCTVIDDGSTDSSLQRAEAIVAGDSRFRLIRQVNSGQLSVFNRAAAEVEDHDLVYFLDADDIWADDHLAIVADAMSNSLKSCDFVFTGKRTASIAEPFKQGFVAAEHYHCLGTSSGITRAFYTWIGDVTSTICLRGDLLKRLLPYPFSKEWRIRADDCLVLGASVVGAVKGYIDASTVLYRIHNHNNLFGSSTDGRHETPTYRLAKERYVHWLSMRECLDRIPCFRLVLAELARSNEWLPFSSAIIFPESALVMPWPLVKRIEVMLAMLWAQSSCKRHTRAQ